MMCKPCYIKDFTQRRKSPDYVRKIFSPPRLSAWWRRDITDWHDMNRGEQWEIYFRYRKNQMNEMETEKEKKGEGKGEWEENKNGRTME
jgi:hypothetical protein